MLTASTGMQSDRIWKGNYRTNIPDFQQFAREKKKKRGRETYRLRDWREILPKSTGRPCLKPDSNQSTTTKIKDNQENLNNDCKTGNKELLLNVWGAIKVP